MEGKNKALKGRDNALPCIGNAVPPLQGFVRIQPVSQGCARASLALGWLVQGLWPSCKMKFRTGSNLTLILNPSHDAVVIAESGL